MIGSGSRFEYGWKFILLALLGMTTPHPQRGERNPKPYTARTSCHHLTGLMSVSFVPVASISTFKGSRYPHFHAQSQGEPASCCTSFGTSTLPRGRDQHALCFVFRRCLFLDASGGYPPQLGSRVAKTWSQRRTTAPPRRRRGTAAPPKRREGVFHVKCCMFTGKAYTYTQCTPRPRSAKSCLAGTGQSFTFCVVSLLSPFSFLFSFASFCFFLPFSTLNQLQEVRGKTTTREEGESQQPQERKGKHQLQGNMEKQPLERGRENKHMGGEGEGETNHKRGRETLTTGGAGPSRYSAASCWEDYGWFKCCCLHHACPAPLFFFDRECGITASGCLRPPWAPR